MINRQVVVSKFQTLKARNDVPLREATTVVEFQCECGTPHSARVNALRGGRVEVTCTCDAFYEINVSGAMPLEECN